MNAKELSPSLEDYLETILQLEKTHRVARVKDIAERLDVQMPSVTGALKNLRARKLVNYEKNSFISLTPEGMRIARSISRRHSVLQSFLEEILLLPPEAAHEQACKMEHSIDPETGRRLLACLHYLQEEVFARGLVSPADWSARITGSR